MSSRAALDLILQELAAARAKHPTFAHSADQTVTVLASEMGEYSSALLRGDIHGPHGAIREAAQIGAVAIRAIEYWLSASAMKACVGVVMGVDPASGSDMTVARVVNVCPIKAQCPLYWDPMPGSCCAGDVDEDGNCFLTQERPDPSYGKRVHIPKDTEARRG